MGLLDAPELYSALPQLVLLTPPSLEVHRALYQAAGVSEAEVSSVTLPPM